MTPLLERGHVGLTSDVIESLVRALVRARAVRRWRLDREVRESAAHLAIAEALAAGTEPEGEGFRVVVERRYTSELRCEARRRRRRSEREVLATEEPEVGEGAGGAGATPEALASARELAGLVERRARALAEGGRAGPGGRRGARRAARGARCGAGGRGAGGRAPAAPPSAVTRRRWRAREREALRRAAREVLGG